MRNETLLIAFNSSAPPYAATDLSTTAFAFVKDSVVRLCETALDAATRSMNTKAKDFFITFPPTRIFGFYEFRDSIIGACKCETPRSRRLLRESLRALR